MTQLGLESRIKRNPLVVSQSDIALFKADRREWLLSSYLGLRARDEPVYGPLRLGTRVHAALEQYYGHGIDLLTAYAEIAAEEFASIEASGVVFDERSWQSEAELGRLMLAGYSEWIEETGVDANLSVINAEEKLSYLFDINGTPVELRGKIDLRARDRFTGQNLVIDWKTTANMSWLISAANTSEQLKTYMLLELLNGVKDPDYMLKGARFVMLRKVKRTGMAKPPFYDTVDVHHNKTTLRNFYTQLCGVLRDYVAVVHALDAGVDHRYVAYPNPASNKRWSPFGKVVEMMDDGSSVEAMIADMFVQQDPHARYAEAHTSLLDTLD